MNKFFLKIFILKIKERFFFYYRNYIRDFCKDINVSKDFLSCYKMSEMFYINIDSRITYSYLDKFVSQERIFMFYELMFVGKYGKESIQIL